MTAKTIISGSVGGTVKPAVRNKINIATPAYGSHYAGVYVRSLYSLLSTAARHGVDFSFSDIDYADIVSARNYLISNFYFNKKDCSHILFLDDDMGFAPDLIHDMLRLKQDVVGVLAPRRNIDLRKLHAGAAHPFEQAYAHACDFIGTPKPGHGNTDFVEVAQCGTGILLISRNCIDEMLRKCPDIRDTRKFRKMPFGARFQEFITPFNKIELPDAELSEDLSFCHRWVKHCNGKIFANVSRKIQHVMQLTVDTRFQDR